MDSLQFLDRLAKLDPEPVYVLHSEEGFLKRQVMAALRDRVLGAGADKFGLSMHEGDKAEFAAVRGDLETLPFLSARRLVVVVNADPLVTRYREALEKYIAQPSSSGVLVLDVASWPSNTRLARQISANATIVCKAPAAQRLPDWCIQRAETEQQKQLTAAAAGMLVDLVGAHLGLLDQQLAKLAVYVGDRKRIDVDDVDKMVGNSRAENMWKIFDAISAGSPAEALTILDRLFDQGEEPMRMLGAFSSQLRRLAGGYRLSEEGKPLPAALAEAGIPPFGLRSAEQQIRHLGRHRCEQLYDWLLEADLGLKGSSQLPPRTLMERLVVQLARPLSRS